MKRYGILILIGLGMASSSVAQMREGMPDVLLPARPIDGSGLQPVIDMFSESYKKHSSPRIVIFWNRDLTDEVVTSYQGSMTIRNSMQGGDSRTNNKTVSQIGSSLNNERDTWYETSSRFSVGVDRNDPKQRTGLRELVDWKVEGAFKRTLLSSGARLIDRELIFRTNGKNADANERVNRQRIETESLLGNAELLMEVLLAADESEYSGIIFKVSVTDIASGETIAYLTTPAVPPTVTTSYYQATHQGFQQVTETEASTSKDIGEALATEVIAELAAKWQVTDS